MGVFNPTRRNRNIGTAKSGHGQDNRMVIPRVAHGEHDFWERIEKAGLVSRTICGKPVKFFVQPTLRDCVHACTVDDVVLMLSLLPVGDWDGIEAILLRQPRPQARGAEVRNKIPALRCLRALVSDSLLLPLSSPASLTIAGERANHIL
jgi:hypothetical protein